MRRTELVALAAALVLFAGVGAATAPTASFDDGPYEAAQTETVTLSASVGDADTAELQVGGEAVGYTLTATLVDEDGDGTVAAAFSVPDAGTDEQTLAAADGDAVESVSETELSNPPLDPAEYRLSVAADGNTTAESTLIVVESAQSTTDANATTDATTQPSNTTAPSSGGSSNGGSPGFGVTAAIVAVFGVALLAARR